MREIVSVHVGQAGVKIGEALWELFCLEHGISSDGTQCPTTDGAEHLVPECSFYEANGKLFPRAVFIDTEPDAIESLRKSSNGQIFNPSFLIAGKESASNCFANGRFGFEREALDEALHQIRRTVERCDSFQGFNFYRSICGGTGSGFAAHLLEYLASEYQRKTRFEMALFPSPNISTIPVESYNAVLSTYSTLPTIDCSVVVDNEAVYKLLNVDKVRRVDDRNLNLLIAQAFSTATLGLRSSVGHTMNMAEIVTNLVPSEKLHFSGLSFAPVNTSSIGITSTERLTRDLFENRADLVSCEFKKGRYIACCLLSRGSLKTSDVQQSISKIKNGKDVTRVPPLPAVCKLAHVSCPMIYPKDAVFGKTLQALGMLKANTAIRSVFERMTRKFSLMYSKKAFLHSFYSVGLNQGDFVEALDDVKDLIHEYRKHGEDASDESFSSNTDGF